MEQHWIVYILSDGCSVSVPNGENLFEVLRIMPAEVIEYLRQKRQTLRFVLVVGYGFRQFLCLDVGHDVRFLPLG